MIGQITAIAGKDLLLERRSKASLNALAFLAGLILVIISFALGPSQAHLRAAAGAVLWIAFSFAGVLAFARAFQNESENQCFEGLLLHGADPRAIYLGKLAATVIVLFVVEVLVLVAMAVLYSLRLNADMAYLLLILALGSVGTGAVGILYGRLTMSLRAREIMLPVLVFPVVIPLLLACVKATTLVLAGSTSGLGSWFELIVVFDVVFVTLGLLTFEPLCRE